MKDSFSSICRTIRKPKLKLLVSFNGSFSRRLPSRKLRYAGGETHIISVEWNTSISKLKRRIADLICPKAGTNFSKLCLNYHVSKSFCSGDDGEEEDPVLFLLESEDDLRYMIEEYQTMELKGQLHSARFWVFVCNTNDDFINDCVNVNINCSFGKALRSGLNDDEKNGCDNLSIVSNKYEGKTKKLGDDFLRKMVLKKQLWVKNLNGIASFRGCKEHRDSDSARESSICQSSPKHLCSVPLNCGPEIVNSSGDSYRYNVLNFKRTNDYIMTSESLPSTERRRRGYGGSIHNHRFGVRKRSNVNESGNYHPFRLDHPGLALFSNVSKQGIPSRSHSDTLKKPLSGSDYYETQREQKFIDHADIFNSPCWGVENILGQVDDHVPHAGSKVDVYGNSLPGARIVDADIDHFTNLGAELDVQTHLDYIDEPLSKSQGEVVHLSNSLDNCYHCCDSVISVLSGDSKLLDVESSYETLDMYQGGAKDFKNSGSSFDLSLHNLSLELSGKVQLHVPCAQRDTSEAFVKSVSNVLDLMDEERINLGSESDVSSDSLSKKCKNDDDDKSKASQQNPKSNPSIAEMYENKKTSSCSKANKGIPTEVAMRYSHLSTGELQIIKNADLEYVKELGQGTFGTVYHGKWKGSDVAIKRIKPSCFTDGAKQEDRLVADFWKEANILGQLHHPNIVALYGVVTDGPVSCLATVTEYMVNGSLKQVLRRKDRTIDRRKRLILAMDAAFGMEYLHEKNIIHFDLKSHNFLVNMRDPQRPVCKIGDLGLSKIKQRTLVSGGIRGTIPWMAPELLSGSELVSEKVDVFSFGIVMWELLTGEEPYADMRSEEIVAGIIKGNLRPEIPSWCDPVWRSLMESCWSSNPDYRPSFSNIAKQLRTMAASMNIK